MARKVAVTEENKTVVVERKLAYLFLSATTCREEKILQNRPN